MQILIRLKNQSRNLKKCYRVCIVIKIFRKKKKEKKRYIVADMRKLVS